MLQQQVNGIARMFSYQVNLLLSLSYLYLILVISLSYIILTSPYLTLIVSSSNPFLLSLSYLILIHTPYVISEKPEKTAG